MRLVYVAPIGLSSRTGDTDHVLSICKELARQGVEVHLVARGDEVEGQSLLSEPNFILHPVSSRGASAARTLRAISQVARQLADELVPDLVYVRPYPLAWLLFLRHLRGAAIPYVCEFNTLTASEYRSKGQPIKGWAYERFDAVAIRHAAGLLAVTNEILTWAERVAGTAKPAIVVGNGVDAARHPLASPETRRETRERTGTKHEALVLAMAGFSSPWHGHDRAVELLSHLESSAELWLIGADGSVASAQAAVSADRHGVRDRVRVFPRLGEQDLSEVLAAVDIGVGPLALERKGMTEAQPIKVRSYLAFGLPVLYNYIDPRLDPNLPFLSQVTSTDPRDLARGVDRLRHDGLRDRERIRSFAVAHLSWESIAAETRLFLEAILAGLRR